MALLLLLLPPLVVFKCVFWRELQSVLSCCITIVVRGAAVQGFCSFWCTCNHMCMLLHGVFLVLLQSGQVHGLQL
jgi:hypothetical protein